MPKARDPNRDKAFEIYKEHNGNIDLIEIADQLGVPDGTVRGWKSKDKWEQKLNGTLQKETERSNKEKNNKSDNTKHVTVEAESEIENPDLTEKQRLFCIYYIKNFNATLAAIKAGYSKDNASSIGYQLLQKTTVRNEIQRLKELKKQAIMLSEDDIVERYMKIAFADMTDFVEFGEEEEIVIGEFGPIKIENEETGEKEYLKTKVNKIKFKDSNQVDGGLICEVSQGRNGTKIKLEDRQKALDWLANYFMMNPLDKHRVEYENKKLELEQKKIEPDISSEGVRYTGIPATMIIPKFAPVAFDIQNREHIEYVFPGGRGSTKSSFISLQIIDLLMKNEEIHAVIVRQVADTLRTSVYAQMQWAIEALGLEDEFYCTVSPLEITRKSTGQKIYFRGTDDPGKIKSIKVPFGYIGILWFEELDQFQGEEAVRKIEQSVIRGGEKAWVFKSFNPPKSANNWANKYIKVPKVTRLVIPSTYLDVPKEWLGKPFIDEAEFLKEVNPTAYENEYLGVANGTGGNIFDNVTIREITDAEIKEFDRIYNGVDWGWYPDPYHFSRMHYDSARHKLYIFMEYRCWKQSNQETANKLRELGITENDLITCDSAEQKSVSDYKAYGLLARGAEKGPGSVDYSMKWLQSLSEIIIDNRRCPYTAEEFLNYEYERDKEGNIISGYPDKNNHAIDAVRYAMNPVWKRRGQ
mgnify:FL=1